MRVTGWEEWVSRWEEHLADLHAWVGTPVGDPPAPPDPTPPAGPPPEELGVRLVRADALRTQLTAEVSRAVSVERHWATTSAAQAAVASARYTDSVGARPLPDL